MFRASVTSVKLFKLAFVKFFQSFACLHRLHRCYLDSVLPDRFGDGVPQRENVKEFEIIHFLKWRAGPIGVLGVCYFGKDLETVPREVFSKFCLFISCRLEIGGFWSYREIW